ncbi:hypothetical protein FBY03_1352 [Pseudomonas sp. SJZ079]|uniref:hypothetical protein n=1 Tax=Pseudomonas sp. SJZ079 TaxID=2572887 RepID=UPI00119A4DA7|nr:hypothetical protein [Pseudomonas sp. SJZ079]TWC28577.1 hypothetical protein FBY03_1352 [Pseudomonas sp. SJZ079]
MSVAKLLLSILGLSLITLSAEARLEVGTVAFYSDGAVEKLVAYQEGRAVWEDTRKRRYIYGTNPLLPAIIREDRLRPAKSYSARIDASNPERLLGTAAGTSQRFVLIRTYRNGRSIRRQWRCESLGRSTMPLQSEVLDVDRYACTRLSYTKRKRVVVREQRTISYSPALQLSVSFERKTKNSTSSRALKQLLAPEQVSATRIRHIHRQLAK